MIRLSTLVATVSLLSSLYADDGKVMAPAPSYHVDVEPRPEVKRVPYVAIFGGVNFSQGGEAKASAFGFSNTGSIRSKIGYLAGVKGGFEFPELFDFAQQDGYMDLLYPAVEVELFYHGLQQKSTVSKGDLDTFTFSVNPLLKSRVGKAKFYFGPGLGGTYLAADNLTTTTVGGKGNAQDLVFTLQGIAGAEFAITERIGIFTEYKYIHWFDTDLKDNGVHVQYGNFGSHSVNAGLKYSF
jgi:opacity protein-like surface antigen